MSPACLEIKAAFFLGYNGSTVSSIPELTSHDKFPQTYKQSESTDKSHRSFSRGASELEMGR